MATVSGLKRIKIITGDSFIKIGGTSSQFLKADGSVDSNSYLTTTGKAYDSDRFDGLNSTQFLRSDVDDTTTGILTAKTLKLVNDANDTFNHRIAVYDTGSTSYGMMLWNANGTSGDWSTMIYGPNQANRRISFGKINTTTPTLHSHITEGAYFDLDDWSLNTTGDIKVNGSTVWHSGNDGSGSGLNADMLDGLNSTSFLRSDTADSASGELTFSGMLTLTGQGTSASGTGYGMKADVALNIEHASGGSSSIYFKSGVNAPSDYGYIRFEDSHTGSGENARLTIGVENDGSADDKVEIKASTIINNDGFSSDNATIVEFKHASSYRGKIDSSGNLSLNGTLSASGYNDSNWNTAYSHVSSTSNPHSVTKAQVGLSGIPNTNGSTANYLRGDGSWVTPPNTNYYLSGLSFNTSDGVLTATVNGATNQTVDLDGRYAYTSHSHNYVPDSQYKNFGTIALDTSTSTANFIAELDGMGFFNYGHATAKCSWSYAGNADIPDSDTGCGTIELAGSVIETWKDGSNKHVRVLCPNTGTSGYREFIYNDQGSSYSPGWRQVWNSRTSDSFNTSGYYSGLRAGATTKSDVGLSGIPNTNGSTSNYLRGDGSWVTPPNSNHYITGMSGGANGTVTITRNGLSNISWDASHSHSDYAAYKGRVVTDLNSYTSQVISGFYGVSGTAANSPEGSYQALIVARNSDVGFQLLGGHNTDDLWYRGWSSSGSTLHSWRRMWHDGNFDPSSKANSSHSHGWGDISGASVNTWSSLRVSTSSGYIDFGPANTSYAHIYTDRSNFYFNKDLLVNGNKVWHAGNDGGGSGLDADMLDGISSGGFVRTDTTQTITGAKTFTNTVTLTSGSLYFDRDTDYAKIHFVDYGSDADWLTIDVGDRNSDWLRIRGADGGGTLQTVADFGDGGVKFYKQPSYNGNNLATESWTSSNYLSTSGKAADSDKLDGLNSSQFLRQDTYSGNYYLRVQSGNAHGLRFWNGSSSYQIRMSYSGDTTWGGRISGETTSDYNMYFRMVNGTNRGFVFENDYNTKLFSINGNGVRSTPNIYAPDFVGSSDERLKENIKTFKPKLIESQYVEYNFKTDKQKRIGVIAQQLEKNHPEFVRTDGEGMKSVSYNDLHSAEIAYLKHENKELKEEVKDLNDRITKLEELIEKLIK